MSNSGLMARYKTSAGNVSERVWIIARREFLAYFSTPLAAVFLVIFVALTGAFAFFLGQFFERGQADLVSFFTYHPWLYLLLVPAIAMRLWAEERKTGTIELLLTLPISPWEAIVGKFLAAWAFIGVALALTIPMWITVNVLGSPDNGVILASYIGSMLTAGAFLSIGSCISALTKNQVIAFIISAVVCFLLLMSGYDIVLNAFRGWAPAFVVAAIQSLSFLNHFEDFTKGIVSLPAVVFYGSVIVFALFANKIILDQKKAA
jgi:ABC-2 type transport system permease protein